MIIVTGTNSSSDALSPSPPAHIPGYGASVCLHPTTRLQHRHHHAKGQEIRRVAFLGQVNRMAIAQRCHSSMSSGARAHWTLPALLVLWTSLCGIASSYPIPSRTNATLLEKKWETLFSRSYLGIAGGKSELNWESDYLQGIKRVRRLYCNVGIGFHLQVLPDGRISGVHSENQYRLMVHIIPAQCTCKVTPITAAEASLIEISTVDRGVISMFGVRSQLFVAMNSRGRLYGTRVFVDECKFKETLLPNNYNAYESFVYKGFYVALSKHGRVKRGNRATTASTVTHFLPRL
ncbi:unnamed protein product [Pleuronectes platessa]|uniref:Fibroblast growth factor n=1 Tax=Pleuronectes platessa TaxID=8262 RepID=A0A9N7YMI5_PLEPL|nr:unnamed protein product [Pleuronectes platessa]